MQFVLLVLGCAEPEIKSNNSYLVNKGRNYPDSFAAKFRCNPGYKFITSQFEHFLFCDGREWKGALESCLGEYQKIYTAVPK